MAENIPPTPLPTDELHPPPVTERSSAPEAEEGRYEAVVERTAADSWLADNEQALASSNSFVACHGLPLARFRRF